MVKFNMRKNNKRLMIGLGMLVLVGLIMLYYFSIRNQEGFNTEELTNTDDALALIKNKNNNVIVFHKMEGCGYCVKFSPIWNKFSEKVDELFPGKNIKCIIVDTSNDLSADVQGFPTVRYYKSPTDYVEFKNERTHEGLTDFVNDNVK